LELLFWVRRDQDHPGRLGSGCESSGEVEAVFLSELNVDEHDVRRELLG
jgi:hypothetical protein